MKITLKDFTTQFVLPLWNQKALEVVDTFVDPSADIQTTLTKGLGPSPLKHNAEQIFGAFSCFEFAIQETLLQQENRFIYKWRGQAIHTGFVLNIKPSGKKVAFSGITSVGAHEGSITRYHCFSDLPRVLALSRTLFQTSDLSTLYSSNIESVISTIKDLTGKRLTKREIECLSLWIKGCSIKETAKLLGGLSNRTVQTFRENIKRKLQVETYQQLLSFIQNSGAMTILLTEV